MDLFIIPQQSLSYGNTTEQIITILQRTAAINSVVCMIQIAILYVHQMEVFLVREMGIVFQAF